MPNDEVDWLGFDKLAKMLGEMDEDSQQVQPQAQAGSEAAPEPMSEVRSGEAPTEQPGPTVTSMDEGGETRG